MKKLLNIILLTVLSLTIVCLYTATTLFTDFGKTKTPFQPYTEQLVALGSVPSAKYANLKTTINNGKRSYTQEHFTQNASTNLSSVEERSVLKGISSTFTSVGAKRERNSKACQMDKMIDEYLSDGDASKSCWYCKVVLVLTNAYLKAARDILGVSVELGKLCAKLGFMIWLAYYILLQVSSVSPITPGKMLQEILVMGFKVALAYKGASLGISFIVFYFVDPIVGLGVDYGSALLDGLMASHNIDAAIANIQTPK